MLPDNITHKLFTQKLTQQCRKMNNPFLEVYCMYKLTPMFAIF